LLTSVGGFRTEANGLRSGGFYTHAEIRQVVAYAAARGITVVPEIEMPGHARAALAAYPALGCTGAKLPVPNGWGVFDDVLCPNEATFKFLEGVLTEVLALFPSHEIHIGGDEVPKRRWKECTECQAIIAREQLGDEEGLQRWFTARIATWLREHGRRMIGWDEILNGGAPSGAIVQAWQGSGRIGVALAAGADVIASPAEWTYVNRPASLKELPLERILRFNPAAAPNGNAHVLGGEAPLWTERVVSPVNVEMMYFPRLVGFAETMWSGPAEPAEFSGRLAPEQHRLERQGIVFGPANADMAKLVITYDTTIHHLMLEHAGLVPGLTIHVTRNGRTLTTEDAGILFDGDARLALQLRHGRDAIGESREIRVADNLARDKPITFVTPTDARYPGTGAYTLTDGARGTTFADGLWNGWQGPDLDATVDLGESLLLHTVSLSVLEEVRSWILYPSSVKVQISLDGSHWRDGGAVTLNIPTTSDGRSRRLVTVALPPASEARWVRIVATNPGKLPGWHPGAGSASWIFADEIVVR
jgi:hexosaminidase